MGELQSGAAGDLQSWITDQGRGQYCGGPDKGLEKMCSKTGHVLRMRRATGELRGRGAGPPDPSEDAVQIPFHVHQGASMVHEALAHLLQPHAGQIVEVQKHLIGFLEAVQPGGRVRTPASGLGAP